MNHKIVTVKIGSSVLLTQRNKLDEFRIARLATQISDLHSRELGVVLVVSGAVACGAKLVSLSDKDRQSRQVAAGIGQVILTSTFYRIFAEHNLTLAQMLLCKSDLYRKTKKQRLVKVLEAYIKAGFVPIINENDVVDLNSFGGNDFLATEIAALADASRLIILSTMEGSDFGVGGSETKQQALQQASLLGINAMILNGKKQNVLTRALL